MTSDLNHQLANEGLVSIETVVPLWCCMRRWGASETRKFAFVKGVVFKLTTAWKIRDPADVSSVSPSPSDRKWGIEENESRRLKINSKQSFCREDQFKLWFFYEKENEVHKENLLLTSRKATSILGPSPPENHKACALTSPLHYPCSLVHPTHRNQHPCL